MTRPPVNHPAAAGTPASEPPDGEIGGRERDGAKRRRVLDFSFTFPMRFLPLTTLALIFTLSATLAPVAVHATTLSKQLEIDFFREVPNRNLKGLAVRSDGRLLDGPALRDLEGTMPADLLWSLVSSPRRGEWLLGTGPEGKVFELTVGADGRFDTKLAIDLETTHVFSLAPLTDGSFLAGSSPQGSVTLVKDGNIVASVTLPVDSIFDFLVLPGGRPVVLAATGNPGRIYRIDVTEFAKGGEMKDRINDKAELEKRGITVFGEIRDRNVRRLIRLDDGRIIAGSAPRGNVYSFAADGGAPRILLENRDSEVTDLHATGDGGFFAALTVSGSGDARLARPTPAPSPAITPDSPDTATEPVRNERFSGRGSIVWFPAGGLPETVVGRSNIAFYRLATHEMNGRPWLLISGGEQGELLAYDHSERRTLNLGATNSAQANTILPLTGEPGRFLLLRNNAAGLSLLDFTTEAPRSIETRKLDLGVAAELGQLRFARAATSAPDGLKVSLRTSFGSDELEGWSPWTELAPIDGGWFAPGVQGRYVQVRVELGAGVASPSLERATLHYLPQNRRPQLTDFRIFPAHLGIVPAPEPAPSVNTTLGQFLNPNPRDSGDGSTARRRGGLMNSQIVPQPGAQFVFWTLTDPDDDNVAATFAISPEGAENWIDLAVDTSDSYVQFDISHLPEGRYRTRLTVREQAPRPVAQRLSYTFETDALIVDRTPPTIAQAKAERRDNLWHIRVDAHDSFSLLEGAVFVLNNGVRIETEQPTDGILDSRRETFVAEIPEPRAANATSVEITVYDKAGNTASTRIALTR